MFKEIIKPLFSLPFRTLGIIFNTFFLFCKKPFYYSKELLNILNSFFLHLTNQESFTKKISRKVDGVNFIFEFDLDPIILSMFLDSYEIELRNCLINYLKKGGIFIDVGASIGYISAIGAGLVGSKGEVHYLRASRSPTGNQSHGGDSSMTSTYEASTAPWTAW